MTTSVDGGGSTGWFSGTGVSTYLSGSDGYRLVAHEIGHNFNAQHDTDGVMMPSLKKIDYFSKVTQNQMCQHIQSKTSRCYKEPQMLCAPNCTAKDCGADGCGGTCGSCSNGTICDAANGICFSPCVPQCNGKNCGSDNCGGSCGNCSDSTVCDSHKGKCVDVCVPKCSSKNCGEDGCGGSCGDCTENETCIAGVCNSVYNPIPINFRDIILKAHNNLRSKYNIFPLKWDSTIEKIAKDWSLTCNYGSNINASILSLGENIVAGAIDSSLEDIIAKWSKQELNYDCGKQKCIGTCSQFLQMVNRNADSLGCSVNICNGPRTSSSAGTSASGPSFPGSSKADLSIHSTDDTWLYVVCDYSPKSELLDSISSDQCNYSACPTNITCASQGIQCGYAIDGCKSIYCGECPVGSQCQNGFCQCIPFTDCLLSKRTCGDLYDGCNTLFCGNCSDDKICSSTGLCQAPSPCSKCKENYQCIDDQCVCTPTKSCSPNSCGSIHNGCEVIECGSCTSSLQCINFTCTNCSNCHMMASCVNDNCKCLPGYIGDGTRCLPVPDTPANALTDWKAIKGSLNDWSITFNDLDKKTLITCLQTNDTDNIISWSNTNLFTKANITFSADIKPKDGAKEWGLIFRQSDSNYLKFTYKNKALYRGISYYGQYKEYLFVSSFNWPHNTIKRLSVISDGNAHQFLFNGVLLTKKYWNITFMRDGNVGLFANGPVAFENVNISTSSRMTINLLKCMSSEDLKAVLQKIFNVYESSIAEIETHCDKKRGLNTGVAKATFTINGNTLYSSSTSMVSELTGKALSSHISLEANSISFEEPIVQSITLTPEMVLEDVISSSTSSFLSTPVFIGIAVGSAAVIAAIVAGIVIGVKKNIKPVDKEDLEKENDKDNNQVELKKIGKSIHHIEKGISVDPFNLSEPRNHSITARSMKY